VQVFVVLTSTSSLNVQGFSHTTPVIRQP